MTMSKLGILFAQEMKKRNNPTSYNELTIATVKAVEPLELVLANSQIQLSEALGNLYIPEWFKFRCDIDKTGVLSSSVPSDTDNAEAVSEVHSYTGADCQMPNAISFLASAILGVRDELLALKCILAVGDKLIVAPLESDSDYVIVDKLVVAQEG